MVARLLAYNCLQENAFGTCEQRFIEMCALAFSVSETRVHLRRLGSTTLGCCMIHNYFGFPLEFLRPYLDSLANWDSPSFALYLVLVFAVPLLLQATIGIWFHQLFMLELRLIFCACSTGSYVYNSGTSPLYVCDLLHLMNRTKKARGGFVWFEASREAETPHGTSTVSAYPRFKAPSQPPEVRLPEVMLGWCLT